jgi:heat-inducible transcriptional repressor
MFNAAFPGRLNPGDPDLDDRQRAVFVALVELHGRAAGPVGSDRIARWGRLGCSPAGVRSTLTELEDVGLVERGRAGAARVPSPRGYEFYVRTLLAPSRLPEAVLSLIDRQLQDSTLDVERLLHEASRVLATLTRQMGLALALSLDDERLTAIDLESLGASRTLLVMGLGGRSRTLVLDLESPLDDAALAQVAAVLRTRLLGGTLGEARDRFAADPELARHSAVQFVARAAAAAWTRPVGTHLLSSGASHMAEQPEFANAHDLGPLLLAVETGDPLRRLMVSGAQGQVAVRVGLDCAAALAGCSLVSFPLPGAVAGAVGVLGPLRMDYGLTLAVVDSVGSRVADLLSA